MPNNPRREYAKASSTKAGDFVLLDDGFTCIDAPREVRTIKEDIGGLYFDCAQGHHYLVGQHSDGEYIGVYPSPTKD